MSSSSQPRNARYYNAPLGPEAVEAWFDSDGRLVKEAEMRKALFEVGVHPSCRAKLFKFLFGIYPVNSTTRDRKSIDIENRANYIALRRRWEVMDRTVTLPDDDLAPGPWYMDLSDDEDGDDSNSRPPQPEAPPTKVVPPARHDAVGSNKANILTESRDSGNFTETSVEDELIDGTTDTCKKLNQGDTATARNLEQPSSEGENRESPQLHHEHDGRGSPFKATTTTTTANPTSCEYCCEGGTVRGGVASLEDHHASPQSSPSPLLSAEGCVAEHAGEGIPKRRRSTSGVLDEEGQAVLKILEFPAKIYAARLSVELEKSYPKAKRIILRDVSRTDRNYHFFSHKRNLRRVHRILMIFSLFHPEIGYAQGMNDILARFLVVTDSEVDSYWLFSRYMDAKRNDFLEDTMMAKVGLVKNLIYELDSNLYEFFENSECRDYLFCHRWLLLDFKREFPFEESIRVFEILSSHYLELDSHEAMRETHKVIAKEFELDGGEMRAERSSVNLGFTFDLFICAAILTMSNSDVISKGTDAASIYGHLNSLSMNLDLKRVLSTAEELFYKYCKLTVTRGFSEIQL